LLQSGEELVLVGAHLLAHPSDAAKCEKREAQATVVRNYADQIVASRQMLSNGQVQVHLLMLGDMNDYDTTPVDAAYDSPISQYEVLP
jgi:predicted extracellular nuclease